MSKVLNCSQCSQNYTTRFVCLVCANYEHCEQCHKKRHCSGEHRPFHPMQRVLPMNQLLMVGELVFRMKILCCPYCGDKELDEGDLETHITDYHKTSADLVRCPACVVFNGDQPNERCILRTHYEDNHGLMSICATCNDCTDCYTCLHCDSLSLCRYCFSDKLSVRSHKPFHPAQFCPEEHEFDQLLATNAGDFGSIHIFCCPYCGDKNFKLGDLKNHCQQYHRDRKSVRCPVCTLLRAPSPRLKGSLLEHLLECHTTGSDARECSVCMEEIGTNVQTLRCGHGFHPSCVADWLRGHTTCPVCRAEHRE